MLYSKQLSNYLFIESCMLTILDFISTIISLSLIKDAYENGLLWQNITSNNLLFIIMFVFKIAFQSILYFSINNMNQEEKYIIFSNLILLYINGCLLYAVLNNLIIIILSI